MSIFQSTRQLCSHAYTQKNSLCKVEWSRLLMATIRFYPWKWVNYGHFWLTIFSAAGCCQIIPTETVSGGVVVSASVSNWWRRWARDSNCLLSDFVDGDVYPRRQNSISWQCRILDEISLLGLCGNWTIKNEKKHKTNKEKPKTNQTNERKKKWYLKNTYRFDALLTDFFHKKGETECQSSMSLYGHQNYITHSSRENKNKTPLCYVGYFYLSGDSYLVIRKQLVWVHELKSFIWNEIEKCAPHLFWDCRLDSFPT